MEMLTKLKTGFDERPNKVIVYHDGQKMLKTTQPLLDALKALGY